MFRKSSTDSTALRMAEKLAWKDDDEAAN